ncbi:MAG: GNAT family N-acetyltransferase [Clostridiales bacterium]|nr:GNAT family N-acetyltransferase [Clostridiales bacterium]
MKINIHETKERSLKYVVIAAMYNNEWLMVKHKDRTTYEIPGGHIEVGETALQAAERELYEETGALSFELLAVGDYSVERYDSCNYGRLFYAKIDTIGSLPDSEIVDVKPMQAEFKWTYEKIQPILLQYVKNFLSIREVELKDARGLYELFHQLDQETKYMMYEADERQTTIEEVRHRIEMIRKNGIMYVIDDNGLGGFIMMNKGSCNRIKHVGYIVIGMKLSIAGQKYGTLLFNRLFEYSKLNHLHRLELSVMTHNLAGVSLYKKMGFQIEGIKNDAMLIDGEYVDEYHMSKLLEVSNE